MTETEQTDKAPMLKLPGQINKGIQPLIVDHKRLRNLSVAFEIPNFAFPDFKPLGIQLKTITKPLEGAFKQVFEELQKNLKELPPKTQEALILLGMRGWYLDLEMSVPFVLDLKKAIEEGNMEYLENSLVEYFDERVDQIEIDIVRRFPDREKIISAALSAHRREEYVLSIPTLLAQADGICKEVFSGHFFIKNDRSAIDKNYIKHLGADTFEAAFLSPLSRNLPICASEKERGKEFNELNRHIVLHGESLDYGTKTNSLKAISFINYMAHLP